MATTYQILRIENSQNKNGQPEVFVDVQIFDDEVGIINYPKWYEGNQAISIIEDNSIIDNIIIPILPALIAQKKIELKQNPTLPEQF